MKPTLLVIVGPTATGKTGLAIDLAEHYATEIISADSRQLFREMLIGTAAPSPAQLDRVRHHFVGTLSVKDYFNASMFEEEVLNLLEGLFATHTLVIMAGGSGMYIDAVCSGIDELPTIDPQIRDRLQGQYKREGIESLRMQLKILDPGFYSRVDLKNPNRILKALEVTLMTGKPYSSFLTAKEKTRPFNILKTGLNLPRPQLYYRIDRRVDAMIAAGLVEEARRLFPLRHLNALNTVGYKELFEYFEGKVDLNRAIELIKQNSRRFAKRQITWFHRDKDIRWFEPGEKDKIIELLK